MKKIGLIIFSLMFLSSGAIANNGDKEKNDEYSFPEVKQTAFKPGEKLRYRFTYGIFDAGEAVLSVNLAGKQVKGRELWNVKGIGRTISAFEWFYKVYDRYESYLDAKGMFPWLFIRRVDEGGYKINQDYTFFQHKNKVENNKGKKFDAPENVQDMISAFYYARTFDFANAEIGDVFEMKIFMDEEIFPAGIKYLGTETIKIRKGKFRCYKFAPAVQEGRVFNEEDDLTVWVTADKNKIPILAKANIKVGSIKMHLVEWEGLANPLAKEK